MGERDAYPFFPVPAKLSNGSNFIKYFWLVARQKAAGTIRVQRQMSSTSCFINTM